jgi:1,4-alpha-glucan branching enzyme
MIFCQILPDKPSVSAWMPLTASITTGSSDRRVTFRLYAPNAASVMVNGEWQGGNRLAMTKDDAGMWSLVTDPIAPEAYVYTFNVDGVTLNDPANPRRNVLFVPGPESSAHEVKDVPHGDVRQVWYSSATMKMRRRMLVYTPPGYDKSNERYPVPTCCTVGAATKKNG